MKRILCLIAAVALVAGACGDDEKPGDSQSSGPPATETAAAKGPLTYTVAVDGPSPEGKNIQLTAFFPAALKVHAGDTIVFDNRSTQAPHTITFGIKPDRSNSPSPVTKAAGFNPAVFGPCVSAAEPTPDLEACPEPPAAQTAAYSGKGYWNSGALVPTVAPEGPKQVEVKLEESIPAGQYLYACVLHPFMGGVVTVAAADSQRQDPKEVEALIPEQSAQAAAAAAAIPDPGPAAGQVATGWGDKLVAVNRFEPAVEEVKAGETVTWKTGSPFEPHTVTFPTDTFSLRFTKAGTYEYVCALHPGMAGTVKVT